MIKPTGSLIAVAFCIFAPGAIALGQSGASASSRVYQGSQQYSGFQIPKVAGDLRYSITASERITFGNSQRQSTLTAGTLSGNFAFTTPNVVMPTSITYSGGYLLNTGGTYIVGGGTTSQPSTSFHDFTLSQAYNRRHWRVNLTDTLRYLPETASSGLSGVSGVGDLGVTTGVSNSQAVLIPYATRIENSSVLDLTEMISGKTSATATGTYKIERFPGYTGGIQTNTLSAGTTLNHRIDARTSTGVSYRFSSYSFISYSGSFVSQGGTVLLKRDLTRSLNVSVSAGPQYSSSTVTSKRPTSLSYSADVSLNYVSSRPNGIDANISYVRATNGGSGLTFGARTDTVTAILSQSLTRSFHVSALGTFSTNTGLQLLTNSELTTQSEIGSVQANRAFTRNLSAYVSYGVQNQSISGSVYSGTPLTGLLHIVGAGITYSPSVIHLGR